MSMAEDDDFLDGCDEDFTLDPVDDETAELLPLFPDSDPSYADRWREVFDVRD